VSLGVVRGRERGAALRSGLARQMTMLATVLIASPYSVHVLDFVINITPIILLDLVVGELLDDGPVKSEIRDLLGLSSDAHRAFALGHVGVGRDK
jgi:hypothetical protein